GEIALAEFADPARIVATIPFRRNALFITRQLADHLPIRHGQRPSLGELRKLAGMRRQYELPRRVIRREAWLQAEANLQQRRHSAPRRRSPAKTVVRQPAEQLAPFARRTAD